MLVYARHNKLVTTRVTATSQCPNRTKSWRNRSPRFKALQESGRRVFRSSELSRTHRERLLRNGFLREVMKGWLMSSSPSARAGDSTPWYASFWEFCARYCHDRFGDAWHLSPEQSLFSMRRTP
jgi:hypothetical protein